MQVHWVAFEKKAGYLSSYPFVAGIENDVGAEAKELVWADVEGMKTEKFTQKPLVTESAGPALSLFLSTQVQHMDARHNTENIFILAVNVLAVNFRLLIVPSPLYSMKKVLYTLYVHSVTKCLY